MYTKILINLFFIVLVSIIQLAFINNLPGYFGSLNLIIVVLVFILALGGTRMALVWSTATGVFLDLYSFMPFGFYFIALTGAVIITGFLLNNFFTNRSVYSFVALTVFAVVFFQMFILVFEFIIGRVTGFDLIAPLDDIVRLTGSVAAANIIATIILFYIMNLISKNFRPVFLVRRKN
jgi:cell shape-determining protein MreD